MLYRCEYKLTQSLKQLSHCFADCVSSTAFRCLAYFLTTKSKKKTSACESCVGVDVPFLIMEVPVSSFRICNSMHLALYSSNSEVHRSKKL